FPVEFAEYLLDARRRQLEALVRLVLVERLPVPLADCPGLKWLDEVPVVVALHQPPEAEPRFVEQGFLPEIARDAGHDTPAQEADDRRPPASKRSHAAQRDGRLHEVGVERLQERELPFMGVEQGPAVRTADALRLVRGAEFERTGALRTVELQGLDVPAFA